MTLTDDYTRIATEEDSEFYARNFSGKQSWGVSFGGNVFDAGHNHTKFVRENLEIFGGLDPENRGWIKVGYFGGTFYIEGNTLTTRQLEVVQDICRSIRWVPYVTVDLSNRTGRLTPEEFLRVDSPNELRRELWGS
jgi:hypothetical protein